MLIPSIDLMNGKAVQLVQGKKKVLERNNPLALAKEFNKYGEVAVIDLDAAFGKGSNKDLIKKICKVADCRVGGGIRNVDIGNEYLGAGAKKIIIGTSATPKFLGNFNKDHLIVAADYKEGYIVNKGWKNNTTIPLQTFIKKLQGYCSEFLITNVGIEGTLKGLDQKQLSLLASICRRTRNKITYAGGIKNVDDIKNLEAMNMNAQLGMSIYTANITLDEAFTSLLTFTNGLVPTIVSDDKGQVLMLAYSNKESLKKTFQTGQATYFSRSRNILWKKGETSGNIQAFIKARFDCDKDALLFTVRQANGACHTGMYSCFIDREFSFEGWSEQLEQRRSYDEKTSYTKKLLNDKELLHEKMQEEMDELVVAKKKEEIIWETADVLYFTFVNMVKNKISLDEVKSELRRRIR